MDTAANKELIRQAFERWTNGQGNFFRLLADDATWTITGSSSVAGTYGSREEFLAKAIAPISARLATPIRPAVESIVADGDMVVVVWKGHATAHDGAAYDNHYAWCLRLAGEKIVEVTAFLDAKALDELLAREPGG
ncbi:hypothetical protein AYO38_06365 [bacterium SCGC AG-212-C10]|nr:hypothetical protein AYO38_06365 [bacterium SCGC AG-212-C10]